MANFLLVPHTRQYEAINIEQVRHITRDSKGKVTIYFDRTHIVSLEGEAATSILNAIDVSNLPDEAGTRGRQAD